MPIVPLDKKRHADLTFSPLQDYSFTAAMPTMPIMPFEAMEASRSFAVVFPAPGSAVPHVLLGLGKKNIFVDGKGRWKAPYVPLYAANYPFSLIIPPTQEDPEKPTIVLAIDEDAPHFRQKDGLPLYGPNGEPSEMLQRITTAMAVQYRRHKDSERALSELALTGAIKDQTVTMTHNGETRTVGGLRIADKNQIMNLPDATLGAWAKVDVLEMLFAQWSSMGHLKALLDDPSCPKPRASK